MKYGGYSKQEGKQSYFESMVKPILLSGEYTPSDLAGYITGHKRVLSVMWPEVGATNFPATCTKFEVPFFIFDGVLDKNTPSELVQGWYDMIEAPEKDLIWFENSGHNPMNDEPDKFKRLLREKLMAVKEREECRI
jgi:pimeloyl-ACP methyl ester carboxylesterase